MKKTIKIMLTLALVIAALCITASAESTNGFYNIGTVDNVAITAYAGAGDAAITAKEVDVNADGAADAYLEGADRLGVTYSAATAGEDYGVILVEGSSLPTASSAIYYINQEEASSTNVTFNVYPATIEATKAAMTLYISSSKADAALVSVPMSYVVGYEEVVEPEEPAFTYGDVNEDTKINGKDSVALAQYVAKMPVTINVDAANVYADAAGKVNGRDSVVLAQYVAKIVKTLPVIPE